MGQYQPILYQIFLKDVKEASFPILRGFDFKKHDKEMCERISRWLIFINNFEMKSPF